MKQLIIVVIFILLASLFTTLTQNVSIEWTFGNHLLVLFAILMWQHESYKH